MDESLPPEARHQAGVFTRPQARAAGWSYDRIQRRLDDGRWAVLLGRGLWRSGQPLTPDAVGWATHLSAPHGTASHLTAGWLHGFPLRAAVEEARGEGRAGHVLVPRQTRIAGVVAHRGGLPYSSTLLRGLPVTPRRRTAIDCLAVLSRGRAISLWGWLASREVLDRGQLATATRARFGHPGTPNLLAILMLTGTGAVSVAEQLLHRLLHQAGLTGWEANAPVRVDGVIVAVADVLFAEARLVVEVDGWSAHGTREAFVNDRRRQNRLMNAGYRVLRFTWDDLTNRPREVLAEITAGVLRFGVKSGIAAL